MLLLFHKVPYTHRIWRIIRQLTISKEQDEVVTHTVKVIIFTKEDPKKPGNVLKTSRGIGFHATIKSKEKESHGVSKLRDTS